MVMELYPISVRFLCSHRIQGKTGTFVTKFISCVPFDNILFSYPILFCPYLFHLRQSLTCRTHMSPVTHQFWLILCRGDQRATRLDWIHDDVLRISSTTMTMLPCLQPCLLESWGALNAHNACVLNACLQVL
jgi:hypothetical protein